MHRDDVSLSENSSNSEDEIDRIHNKAKEALEKAKSKQYPAFAIRSNIAFNSELLSPEDVPLPAHMITFGVKDFLHVKERFNQDWWIARLVRIGGSLGFIPSPAKIEAIRMSIHSNQTAQPMTNDANNSPEIKDNQPIFNSFEDNSDNPQVNLNERPLLFNNQIKKQSSQPGPIQNLAASRRLVPELDEDFVTNEGLNGEGDNQDANNTALNSASKLKTQQSAPAGSTGMKRKPFLKKLNMIQPYEIVPCMRPVIFLGPALKGFEVTDMMQKAIFDFLRKHFEGRIIVTRINADITQMKRMATTNFDKKSSSLDNKKKNNTLLNIQQEIERIFDLSSTMQLVVLDADTINHPSQIAKTCLAPLLVYIKIVSLKVLSRLIKNRGKSQKHNASFQISAAEKLQQCADETFDLILDQNNLNGATECLRHFLDTYWTATHPPHLKSKADRILGNRDNSGRKSSKHDLDYSGNVIIQMGIDAGFTLKEMNALLGPTLGWTTFNKNTDTSSADAIHDPNRSNLIWGGDPEEYRSDREMRVDQKDRNSSSLASMLDIKNSKNETVTPITKPIPPEIFASKKHFLSVYNMDTPTELRQLIIHHYQAGVHTQQQIANIVQCPRSTVGDIIRHFNQQGTTDTLRKGKSGRKKSLNVRIERAICRTSKTNPQMTARQIKEEVGGCAANVSIDTIKRTLRRHGRIAYRPSACPALNARQKATRLRWCQNHRFWTTDQWRKVIFSDETYVDVDEGTRTQFVRRGKMEKISANHTTSHRAFRQRLLFWGCFSGSGGRGPMVFVPRTMNTPTYINTLQNHLVPYKQSRFPTNRCIFQHNNASSHKSGPTVHFLQVNNIRTVEWPPYSPDLNPIENLWSVIKKKIHQRPMPSKEDVLTSVEEAWKDPSIQELCLKLADSMVDRITACIASKGGYTQY